LGIISSGSGSTSSTFSAPSSGVIVELSTSWVVGPSGDCSSSSFSGSND